MWDYPHDLTVGGVGGCPYNFNAINPPFFIFEGLLFSSSGPGPGQVRVRKVRVRSQSCEFKDLNKNLRP